MENDLLHQQKLLWELFKVWVNNYNRADNDLQVFEINTLYERLSRFLNTESNAVINHTSIAGPMLEGIEKEFPSVINFITDVVGPERICCLAQQASSEGIKYADLLIIIPESHPQSFPEIETVLNFACLKHYHLSCSMVKSSFFDRMVREGHIYYSLACNPENLVFDNGKHKLPKLKLEKHQEKVEQTNRTFLKWMDKAKTFYACAESHRMNNPAMAAFMLHQATELSLRALTKTLTGQERTTHSIKNLLLFSLRITTKLSVLMNNQEAEDERLMAVLEAAYLGFRYADYNINDDDLNIWFERIQSLQSQTSEIFSKWMAQYDSLIKTT